MHAGRLYPNDFALQFASIRFLQKNQGVLLRNTCIGKLPIKNIVLVRTYGKSSFVIKQSSSGYTVEIRESLLCLNSHWKKLHRDSGMKSQLSLFITYPIVWRLEAEIGGNLHVRAAEGENTQAEVQQLQSQERDLGVSLLQEGQGTGMWLWLQDCITSVDFPCFTQSLCFVHIDSLSYLIHLY